MKDETTKLALTIQNQADHMKPIKDKVEQEEEIVNNEV